MKLIEMDLWDLHDDPTQVDGYVERLATHPEFAFAELKSEKLKPREIKIAERAISKLASLSLEYAVKILNGKRFKIGEKVIAKDVKSAYGYADQVIGGRFELGEKAIAKDAKFSYHYALHVIRGRFLTGEESIMKSIFKDKYLKFTDSIPH